MYFSFILILWGGWGVGFTEGCDCLCLCPPLVVVNRKNRMYRFINIAFSLYFVYSNKK